MSKLVAFAAIQGGYNIVSKAEGKLKEAIDKYGPKQEIGFPNTAYYLPVIYSLMGEKVETAVRSRRSVRWRCWPTPLSAIPRP